MANAVYPIAKEHFMAADIDMVVDDIVVLLTDTEEYTYSAAHDALADVAASARISVGGATPILSGNDVTSGVFDANDITLSAVTGDQFEAIILYQSASSEATSYLVCYIDTNVSGLPLTPNGGNVTITWDNGANKIFAL
jgi:hypothetical protein